MLVALICIGDGLVGTYLLAIASVDTFYGNDYCKEKPSWLTSLPCAALGIVSTVGSQLSLYSMTAMSLIRLNGTVKPMNIAGPIKIKTVLKSKVS